MEDLKNAMQEAEKPAEDTTKENKEEKAPENVDEQPKESEKAEEVDYKVGLEKAKGILEHKEKVIKTEKQKRKEAEEKPSFNEEELDEKINSAIQSQVNGFKKSYLQDDIDDEISRVSSNDDEKELIKFHFENSIQFSGNTRREIIEKVKQAKLLANEKKIMDTNRELSEALKSHATTRNTAETAGEKVSEKEDDKNYNADEQKLLDSFDGIANKIRQNAPASNIK